MSFDNHDFSNTPGITSQDSGSQSQNSFGNSSGNRSYNNNGSNSYSGTNNSGFSSNSSNRQWTGNRNYSGGNAGGGFNKGGFQKNYQRNEEPEGEAVLYKPYVGTGNKEAPPDIVETMKRLAAELEKAGYLMRCGGMDGPEDIFEKATTKNEIHLPWRGFNEKDSKFTFTPNQAKELAKQFQTGFDGLKPVIQTFLAKNVRMIMGKDLKSPALFMITWSDDGAESLKEKSIKTGNAGHAIAIADALRIPIFNLGKHDAEIRLKRYLKLNDGQEQQITEI